MAEEEAVAVVDLGEVAVAVVADKSELYQLVVEVRMVAGTEEVESTEEGVEVEVAAKQSFAEFELKLVALAVTA